MPVGVEVDGKRIRQIRESRACLSMADAARMAGISVPGLWKIETNGRTLISTLRRLADVLGVHPSDLMAAPPDYALITKTSRLIRARDVSSGDSPGVREPAIR